MKKNAQHSEYEIRGVEEKEKRKKKSWKYMELRKKQQRGSPRRQEFFFLQVTKRFDKQLFFKKRTFGIFRLITHMTGKRQGRTTLNNWMTSWMPRRKDCEK